MEPKARDATVETGQREAPNSWGVATGFEVEVPAAEFALAETFDRAPAATVRLERTVGAPGDRPTPFAWVSGVETATDLLAADPSVASARKVGEDGDAELFEVRFDGRVGAFFRTVFDHGGVVLRATAADGTWTLQLRFADRNGVGEVFDDEFRREYDATVVRLYGSTDAPAPRSGLTDKQRRALTTAFELGYYSVPRDVDLESVGDRLGVSRQAVSERLRRAHQLLVADFLGRNGDEE
jgi:hypothetical protein